MRQTEKKNWTIVKYITVTNNHWDNFSVYVRLLTDMSITVAVYLVAREGLVEKAA